MGLKAKPTKPVTEVLRPVVAKYGLHLNELVARLVSDLGACGCVPHTARCARCLLAVGACLWRSAHGAGVCARGPRRRPGGQAF